MHFSKFRPLLAVLWATLFFCASLAAQPAAPGAAAPFELRRGIIVEKARNAIYLAAPGGEIHAVEPVAGRVLWATEDASLPLIADGAVLVAQGDAAEDERLPIVVLDAQSGRKVFEADVPLPEGVRALVSDEMGRSFRVRVLPEGNGYLISWTWRELIVEGQAPPPGTAPRMRVVNGAARVDVKTGKVITIPGGPPIDDPVPPARWQSGNVIATTAGGRGGPLTLKRTDARNGAPLPDKVLAKKALFALPSAERGHLVASERVGEGGPDDPEYRWSIFSSETGDLVGELRRDVSAAPFFLSAGNIVFESRPYGYRVGEVWIEEPLKLRALRLSQGVPVWDHPLRHLEYRGPVPPGRGSR